MNESREKLLTKLRALLNMADTSRGAHQAEAESFLKKAHELMAKHGIEEMELSALEGNEAGAPEITEERVDTGVRRRVCDQYIFRILKSCFDVDVIFSTHRLVPGGPEKQTYILIGDQCDIAFARIAIPIMHRTMISTLGLYLKNNNKTWTSVAEHSVCDGVRVGFVTASEQGKELATKVLSKEKKEQYGLILVNKADAIKEYVSEKYTNLRSTVRGRQDKSKDDGAFDAGYRAGKDMDVRINNKIKA
jgi:hypothetical protein